MTVDPDLLTAMSERMVRATPQAVAMGMRLVSSAPGDAAMAVPYRADLVGDPATGVLAGGVITTLLDHVCGLAVLTAVGQDNSTATLDLRIDYMRAAEPGREVIGHATCYKLGRSIAFVRAVAFDRDEADPVATAQGAFALSGLRTAA
jgi:uncharacterized protein (TIGR00369 family)